MLQSIAEFASYKKTNRCDFAICINFEFYNGFYNTKLYNHPRNNAYNNRLMVLHALN